MPSSYHGIIFTGSDSLSMRSIGAYRIRTVCQKYGYKIKVIDFSHNINKTLLSSLFKKFVGPKTLFFGISSTFMDKDKLDQILLDEEMLATVRSINPNIQIVIGGAQSDVYQNESKIDWVVKGYADVSIVNLLDYLTGKTGSLSYVETGGVKVINSNDDYKVNDTSDLTTEWLYEDYIQSHEALPIEIARGCIFKCSFCAYPLNGKKKFDYIRAKENFTEEIDRNFERFGTKHYLFMDDTFNDSDFKLNLIHDAVKSAKTPITFCGYIKPELLVSWPHHAEILVSMGIEGASLGVESFNPMTRSAIGKGMSIEKIMDAIIRLRKISNYTVGTQANMIVGAPWESKESIMKSFEWYKANTYVINNVQWTAMKISEPKSQTYSSAIDLNPQKFGYTISKILSDGSCYWKNNHMNITEAVKIKEQLVKESAEFSKFGGWQPGLMRIYKDLDVTSVLKENILQKDLTIDKTQKVDFIKNYFAYQVMHAPN